MRISDWSSDVCSSDLSLPTPPSDKAGWMPVTDETLPAQAWAALGLRRIGGMAVRVDRLERLTATLRARARKGPFPASSEERRVGTECVSKGRSKWPQYN